MGFFKSLVGIVGAGLFIVGTVVTGGTLGVVLQIAGLLLGALSAEGRDGRLPDQKIHTSREPGEVHPVVYGWAKTGTILHDLRVYSDDPDSVYHDDNSQLYMPLTICHGSRDGLGVAAIYRVYFNDETGIGPSDLPVFPYTAVTVGHAKALGGSTQNVATLPVPLGGTTPRSLNGVFGTAWNASTDKGAGLAALVLRLRNKVVDEEARFPQGPPHVTCLVQGNFVEDTRSEVSGVNITFTEANPDTITRASGSFITDGWAAGDRVQVTGSSSNNGSYTIASRTVTVLTLDDADDLADEGPASGVILKRWGPPLHGGDNPAMCIRDYLLSDVYGPGFPASFICDTCSEIAADYCEEQVSTPEGDENRFRCNGAVDTSQPIGDNLLDLLSSCRGALIWQGGQFHLRIRSGALTPAGDVELDQSNIVGDWSFTGAGVSEKVNLVVARYISPGDRETYRVKETQWPTIGDTTYLDEDDGFENRLDIELPFTRSYYTAQHIAQTTLKESRQVITAGVTCTEEALRLQVGDVVNVTHETPGWTDKQFIAISMALAGDTAVRLALAEYAQSVYTIETLDAEGAEPGIGSETGSVPAPTGVVLSGNAQEGRLYITWNPPPNYGYVAYYEIEGRHIDPATGGDGVWRPYPPDDGRDGITQSTIYGVHNGEQWEARVRTVSTMDGRSAWAYSPTKTVYQLAVIGDSDWTLVGVDEGVEVEITNYDIAALVEVYARENAGSGGDDPPHTPQYRVTELRPGDAAYLIPADDYVRAFLVAFNAYAEPSPPTDVKEAQMGGGVGPSAPPSGLSSPSQDYESIDISWTNGDVSATTRVYVNGQLYQTAPAAYTSDTIEDLESDTTYDIVIRHYKNGVENPTDNSVTISQATAKGTLGTPTGLAVQTVNPAKVKLTWALGSPGGEGATYVIERSDTGAFGGEEEQIGTTGVGATQFTHEDEDEAEYTWYFRIKATRNKWNDSSWTSGVQGTYGIAASLTGANACAAPASSGLEDHCIQWTSANTETGVHHIEIWRNVNGGGYAKITDDVDPFNTDVCQFFGTYGYTYDDLDDGDNYKYRLDLRLNADETLLDQITDIAANGDLGPCPE